MLTSFQPQHVILLSHPALLEAAQQAQHLAEWLRAQGVMTVQCAPVTDQQVQACGCDLLVALGGDGTMLRASRMAAMQDTPVLGINMGRFGFLTEVERNEWPMALRRVLDGDFWIEKRMMLHAEQWRSGQLLAVWDVLNEVAICRGAAVRPVRLQARIDGSLLANYMADGLIAATPTGSTAYALAAGGPVLPPELRNILLVPVAPHLSIDRAIVLSDATQITICPQDNLYPAVLSGDGLPSVTLSDGDEIRITTSALVARFIRFHPPGYFYRSLTMYMQKNPAAGDAL
jgi:NAD+ kinase